MQGEGVRDISSTVGYDTKLVKLFQTFYYTRAVTLMPSMRQFANSSGVEAGTVRGSQYSPSVFIGDRDRGFYGGASLFLATVAARTSSWRRVGGDLLRAAPCGFATKAASWRAE